MVKISLPRILEKTGPGRQVELPLRTHFSPKKITRVIKPWREMSFAVSFSTVAHQRQETQWQKKPKLSGYRVTGDWKTDKAASPFSSSPSPSSFPRTILSSYAAKHSQPSNICVASSIWISQCPNGKALSLNSQKTGYSLLCFSLFPLLHFSALIITGD